LTEEKLKNRNGRIQLGEENRVKTRENERWPRERHDKKREGGMSSTHKARKAQTREKKTETRELLSWDAGMSGTGRKARLFSTRKNACRVRKRPPYRKENRPEKQRRGRTLRKTCWGGDAYQDDGGNLLANYLEGRVLE